MEGSVQAAVSSFSSNKRAMLDREVMLHFRDVATRKHTIASPCFTMADDGNVQRSREGQKIRAWTYIPGRSRPALFDFAL